MDVNRDYGTFEREGGEAWGGLSQRVKMRKSRWRKAAPPLQDPQGWATQNLRRLRLRHPLGSNRIETGDAPDFKSLLGE